MLTCQLHVYDDAYLPENQEAAIRITKIFRGTSQANKMQKIT